MPRHFNILSVEEMFPGLDKKQAAKIF